MDPIRELDVAKSEAYKPFNSPPPMGLYFRDQNIYPVPPASTRRFYPTHSTNSPSPQAHHVRLDRPQHVPQGEGEGEVKGLYGWDHYDTLAERLRSLEPMGYCMYVRWKEDIRHGSEIIDLRNERGKKSRSLHQWSMASYISLNAPRCAEHNSKCPCLLSSRFLSEAARHFACHHSLRPHSGSSPPQPDSAVPCPGPHALRGQRHR